MREEHLFILMCPKTQSALKIVDGKIVNGRIKEGLLINEAATHRYPIINYIPRFVPLENYAKASRFQWNKHRPPQYDDPPNFTTSTHRLAKHTKCGTKLHA